MHGTVAGELLVLLLHIREIVVSTVGPETLCPYFLPIFIRSSRIVRLRRTVPLSSKSLPDHHSQSSFPSTLYYGAVKTASFNKEQRARVQHARSAMTTVARWQVPRRTYLRAYAVKLGYDETGADVTNDCCIKQYRMRQVAMRHYFISFVAKISAALVLFLRRSVDASLP
jgi:hypothetical protein